MAAYGYPVFIMSTLRSTPGMTPACGYSVFAISTRGSMGGITVRYGYTVIVMSARKSTPGMMPACGTPYLSCLLDDRRQEPQWVMATWFLSCLLGIQRQVYLRLAATRCLPFLRRARRGELRWVMMLEYCDR